MSALRAAAPSLAAFILLAGPFGEGGRLPGPLAALHGAVLLLVLFAGMRCLAGDEGRPHGRGTGVLLAAAVLPALALLASAGAGYPYAAMLGVMDRLAAAGAFAAAAVLLARPSDLLVLRNAAVASGTGQAVVALLGALDGGPAGAARVFLNRNHLGAFLNIGLLLALAAADEARLRRGRRAAALFGAAAVLHLAALLALQSRGALLGLAAGTTLLIGRRWGTWTRRMRAAAIASALVVAFAGGGLVALRFARSDDPDRWRRVRIWEAAAAMVSENPLLGIGPGQFPHEAARHNFPLDRTPVRYGRGFDGGHSVLLTLAVEDGVPAAILAVAAIAAAIALLLRRPGQGAAAAAALGTGAALLALLVQGLVEDLQERPVIVLGAALLAGSALAATRDWRATGAGARRPWPAATLTVLLAWIGAAGVALPYAAWREASAARAGGRAAVERMRRAARLDPANAAYQHDLAMAAINSGPPDPERYTEAAIRLDEARRLAPREPRFALLRARLEARAARVLFADAVADARAARLYAEAAHLSPTDPRPHFEQAGYLADGGRTGEALEAAGRALAIEPHYRRARLLQVALLLRRAQWSDARAAWGRLRASDLLLRDYVPDSGYAQEIVADAPTRRAEIEAALAAPKDPADASEVAEKK